MPTAVVPTGAASRAAVAPVGPVAACWTAGEHTWPLINAAFDHLRLETRAAERVSEVPRLLLTALVLRLDPPGDAGAGAGDETFRRFRAAVEVDFRHHHDVGHYARALGWSARTLSRACLAATGRTAKDLLAERLLLEAKRLLAHDGLSPVRCGQRLGFPDASNFSAFFLRGAGMRPGAWQAEFSSRSGRR
ncbi:helix-turn-helix domain-containing protein [Paractinoplanes atraurantiacus]|uniref:helix-turn-helix domain-containing protein n=1 Tax=Paractinoplanes atraurantiacus TaxID=1036182 RepID=UPI001FE68311|nr:AraC family transcriptional regulator [Actinoplanes atraurantiacus]